MQRKDTAKKKAAAKATENKNALRKVARSLFGPKPRKAEFALRGRASLKVSCFETLYLPIDDARREEARFMLLALRRP